MKKDNVSQADVPLQQQDGFFRAVARAFRRYRLGDLLVARGAITPAQLEDALAEQKSTGLRLGKILVRQGAISALLLYGKLTEQWCLRLSAAGVAMMLQAVMPAPAHADSSVSNAFTVAATARPADHDLRYPELFGTHEARSDDITAFRKWTAVLERFERQMQTATHSPSITHWKGVLRNLEGRPVREQIESVNSFFNQVAYVEDRKNYGKTDYWATPAEFMGRGGDCEDFAIAKYTALRSLGFPAQRLRIAIVHDEVRNTPHAVLIVYSDEGNFVLDNQDQKVESVSAVRRYKPIFSINSDSWWLHKA